MTNTRKHDRETQEKTPQIKNHTQHRERQRQGCHTPLSTGVIPPFLRGLSRLSTGQIKFLRGSIRLSVCRVTLHSQ
nr:MAG TPA: hypothetical protein [Caudoviricetes sp.]